MKKMGTKTLGDYPKNQNHKAMNNPNFEKHVQEANGYLNKLAADLGHPEEKSRVFIIWRAVMHVIRERIQISESLDLISQLPLLLKGYYVHDWKYHDKPPLDFDTIEGMIEQVEKFQERYGEHQFDWGKSTEEIISITLKSLEQYLSKGQLEHIKGQMPKELQLLFD